MSALARVAEMWPFLLVSFVAIYRLRLLGANRRGAFASENERLLDPSPERLQVYLKQKRLDDAAYVWNSVVLAFPLGWSIWHHDLRPFFWSLMVVWGLGVLLLPPRRCPRCEQIMWQRTFKLCRKCGFRLP